MFCYLLYVVCCYYLVCVDLPFVFAKKLMETKIIDTEISNELKKSYLTYAMSVIVSRALPDVRDGLKPVQRRILYGMQELGLAKGSKTKKCARIVGDVMGKYHPHGDSSIYEALVRMAQYFSYRYPLVEGQGNFGSIDGDPPAAMRYTEAKLEEITAYFLDDINKETVDFVPNYDNTTQEPTLLPTKIPNILINGCSGIAVGMATNVLPHNLIEIMNALIYLIENPSANLDDLIKIVKGPDFPTGGTILGFKGIKDAYETGKGAITLRANAEFTDNEIIINEIPYMTNKADIITKIALLVREKKIEGISSIRDESDKKGMRIYMKLSKGSDPAFVFKHLCNSTELQTTLYANTLALINNQPKLFSLRELLEEFIKFRQLIVLNRTKFILKKSQERKHIVDGLIVAVNNIDKVVELIKKAKQVEEAKQNLKTQFSLSDIQVENILAMQLRKLTSLEQNELKNEQSALEQKIKECQEAIFSPEKILNIVKEEFKEIVGKFGDKRKTQIIVEEIQDVEDEDLIEDKSCMITLSHSQFIKRTDIATQQKRGGVGSRSFSSSTDDFVEFVVKANIKDLLLFFTDKGKVFWQKAYKIQEMGRNARGSSVRNLFNLSDGEKITKILISPKVASEDDFVLFATKKGTVKLTALNEYSNPRSSGLIAINLREDDSVVDVFIVNPEQKVFLATKQGKLNKFLVDEVRVVGRSAMGVIGIDLKKDDKVISASVANPKETILTITEKGYGKRTPVESYPQTHRAGVGVININITDKTGEVVRARCVRNEDNLIVITTKGMIINTQINQISVIGRNTQGVRLIRLKEDDKVIDCTVFEDDFVID